MKIICTELLKRKGELPHWQQGGSVCFVRFRSARGNLPVMALKVVETMLSNMDHYRYFLNFAVIMPDHVHLLLFPNEFAPNQWYDLSLILKSIKGSSAHEINKALDTTGSVWQKESYDRIIRNEKEYWACWEYMLQNPVKAGLVERPEEYSFFVTHFPDIPCIS